MVPYIIKNDKKKIPIPPMYENLYEVCELGFYTLSSAVFKNISFYWSQKHDTIELGEFNNSNLQIGTM